MRQHVFHRLGDRVMTPQVLIEHWIDVGRSGDLPLLVGLHLQPRKAVAFRQLGEDSETGENPISILG